MRARETESWRNEAWKSIAISVTESRRDYVAERFINHGQLARNGAREFDEQLTFGQRLADRFAQIIGSWQFIIIQSVMLAVRIALNITASDDESEPPVRKRPPASEE